MADFFASAVFVSDTRGLEAIIKEFVYA